MPARFSQVFDAFFNDFVLCLNRYFWDFIDYRESLLLY